MALFSSGTNIHTGVMRSGTRLVLLPLAAAALLTYVRYVRPWQLTWGATPEEVSRTLPGDNLVPKPTFNATRAITIAAPPGRIWPWLVQAGLTRGGWYSYDILDNLWRPSARRIIPELQNLAVGDIVPMSPDGKHGMPVLALNPPTSMIWGTPGDTTWTWQLDPVAPNAARLVSRVRSRYRWFRPSMVFSALLEFADVWMMRRMLLNIRGRAEAGRT